VAQVAAPAAVVKAEKDPAAAPEPDDLRDLQLRLFDTLRKEKEQREAQRERDLALRGVDATRAPAPVYLGKDLTISHSALSPDGRHLLVATEPKSAEAGRAGKMP